MFRRKSIFDAVNEKLFERAYVRPAIHLGSMYEMGRLSPPERPMDFRGTHGEIGRYLSEWRPIRTVPTKLEYNNNVLGL
jgi:hypothetical protein